METPPKTRKSSGNRRRRTAKKSNKEAKSLLKFEILGLVMMFFGIFATVGTVGIDTGSAGMIVDEVFSYAFGIGRIVVALALVLLGLKYIMVRKWVPVRKSWVMCGIILLLLLALIHAFFVPEGAEFSPILLKASGGLFGGIITFLLRELLGQIGAILALVVFLIVTIMIWKKWSLSKGLNVVSDKATEGIQEASDSLREQWHEHQEKKAQRKIFDIEKTGLGSENNDKLQIPDFMTSSKGLEEPAAVVAAEPVETIIVTTPETINPEPAPEPDSESESDSDSKPAPIDEVGELKPIEIEKQSTAVDLASGTDQTPKAVETKPYVLPPITFLKHGKKPTSSATDEVRENARILQETFKSFNIDVKILHASQGPTVTRYEIEPAAGVKVSKIVHLADDIALSLAATDVRIEAPIPGKAAIGIEVPNRQVTGVNLRDVLDAEEFQKAGRGVPVGLGMDIAGNPVIADLTKMPHLLVAGSTGSGKSVCINTLIASILFKQRPEDVKLILIDPKVVELSNYNGIPHLMTPVVTDAKKSASVLRWAVKEMDRRYRRFAETGTRDLARYNALNPDEPFPFVVIIIDELADLMMVASNDVEDSICRLAQKARACGMHLVLATQRPSVDVLTGIIKANVPSRISFAVSSQIDSRTILDMAGAEKLLGKGDMLFYPMGASKPLRVQGAFISDAEIDKTVSFIQRQGKPDYDETVQQAQTEDNGGQEDFYEDELLEQAVDMILETGQASASMLQRRFRVGYTRAARLIDTMEAMHIVGPNNGSKPREILMQADEVHKRYFSNQQ